MLTIFKEFDILGGMRYLVRKYNGCAELSCNEYEASIAKEAALIAYCADCMAPVPFNIMNDLLESFDCKYIAAHYQWSNVDMRLSEGSYAYQVEEIHPETFKNGSSLRYGTASKQVCAGSPVRRGDLIISDDHDVPLCPEQDMYAVFKMVGDDKYIMGVCAARNYHNAVEKIVTGENFGFMAWSKTGSGYRYYYAGDTKYYFAELCIITNEEHKMGQETKEQPFEVLIGIEDEDGGEGSMKTLYREDHWAVDANAADRAGVVACAARHPGEDARKFEVRVRTFNPV